MIRSWDGFSLLSTGWGESGILQPFSLRSARAEYPKWLVQCLLRDASNTMRAIIVGRMKNWVLGTSVSSLYLISVPHWVHCTTSSTKAQLSNFREGFLWNPWSLLIISLLTIHLPSSEASSSTLVCTSLRNTFQHWLTREQMIVSNQIFNEYFTPQLQNQLSKELSTQFPTLCILFSAYHLWLSHTLYHTRILLTYL